MTHPGTTVLRHPELASVLCNCDVAALNELSDSSQIRAWTRRQMARYKKCFSALLAIHNSIAPINMLPTEILRQVFAYVPFKSVWCTASWMVSLQSVCRRWRSVLLSTPEYWLQGLYVIANAPLSPRMQAAVTQELAVDIDEDGNQAEEEDNDEDDVSYSNPRDLFLARSAPCPLELHVWGEYCVNWKVFEGHFDRVTAFYIKVQDEDELYDFLDVMTTSMKHLETLELSITQEFEMSLDPEDLAISQWDAEGLPRLGELRITNRLFCRETTVPSLHAVTLFESRDVESLPSLLDALERCPALARLSLSFDSDLEDSEAWNGDQAFDRIVNLPNLLSLNVGGEISDIYHLSSCLSFPPTTRINARVQTYGALGVFPLPSILPRRLSRLHTSPTVDRLYIHVHNWNSYWPPPEVSMIGSVHGAERLRVSPVFRLGKPDSFLRFLEVFAACTVTELALDFGCLPVDVDREFWKQFFAALPDIRRLELLSRTGAKETKRDIAKHFLSSARILEQSGHETSLAWVVYEERSCPWYLEELDDVVQLLQDHAHQGGRLKSVELYITIYRPDYDYNRWCKLSGVSQITTDRKASRRRVISYYASEFRLTGAADTLTVGGGWGFPDGDLLDEEEDET